MIKHVTILLAFLMMIGSQVSAFYPDHLHKLMNTGNCVKCDLTDVDLRNQANLYGANLENANLRGADLRGAILCNTTMPDGSVIYSGC